MKKANIFFIFLVLQFSVFLSSCVTNSVDSPYNEKLESIPNSKLLLKDRKDTKKIHNNYEIIDINENLEYLNSIIKYPQFDSFPGLNKHVKNLIESGWNDFKEFAKKDWNEITNLNSSLPPYEYFVDTVVSGSKNIISIYFSIYSYNGGAHGQTEIKTLNYEKNTEKFLTIKDISPYSYEELSEICRNNLYKSLISDSENELDVETQQLLIKMIQNGTEPIAANFESFTLDKNNNMTIYFQQGNVAPYYYGKQAVTFKLLK